MGLLDGLMGDDVAQLGIGLLGGQSPNLGANIAGAMQYMQAQQMEAKKRQMLEMQMRQQQMAMEEHQRQQARQRQIDDLAPQFGNDMGQYADQISRFDPMKGLAIKAQLSQLQQKQQPKYHVVNGALVPEPQAPGQQTTPVYQAPEKTPDWKDPAYVEVQKQIRAAGRPQVTTNVMPPREIFKDSMALKKDFDAQPEIKAFKEVQGAWDQISTALKDPSAANDLAAATKFMKLLDPGSVVRESELAMAMQASGKLDRFMNYANQLKTGQKLTPAQREDFYRSGEALYNASKNRFGQTIQQYEGIAKQYGLDEQFIPKQKEEPKSVGYAKSKLGAKQAPDGKWYVQSGGKWFRVEE